MISETENDGPSRSQSPDEEGDQENGDSTENQEMAQKPGDTDKDGQQKKPASNAKDPSRPRRKKARRACYACQRAHLTCGDERPCQRCIKRGLQDACADGVRKKAKYLHDAPPEALVPGGASNYQYFNNYRRQQQQPQSPTYPVTPVNDIFPQQQSTTNYPIYGPVPGNSVTTPDNVLGASAYSTRQSPITAQFPGVAAIQSSSNIQTIVQPIPQTAAQDPQSGLPGYDSNMFDANDLNQYDFDPTIFNFGNHYGALEFGMLGQISGGAAETPPGENGSQMTGQNGNNAFATPGTMSTNYSGSPVSTQPFGFNQDQTSRDWGPTQPQPQASARQGAMPDGYSLGRADTSSSTIKQETPSAFSIGIHSAFATPTSGLSPQQPQASFDHATAGKPSSSGSAPNSRPGTQSGHRPNQVKPQPPPELQQQQQQPSSRKIFANANFNATQRRGDPSYIYETVTEPYPYTRGFHNLFKFVASRFSKADTGRIAKALASIRPSFLTCTTTLTRQDLIFMEKCFQRSLFEMEHSIITSVSTPTVVCRRTGEIAAVGKEFSILTGWKREVLLGQEPSLNVNTGGGQQTGASFRTGTNAPKVPEGSINSSLPQPMFIGEILDDESAVSFYERFAEKAFGDSKGTVTTMCRLLKYKTKHHEVLAETEIGEFRPGLKRKRSKVSRNEAGIDELRDIDGQIECGCVWTVKRDLFDLPMMIIMNVGAAV